MDFLLIRAAGTILNINGKSLGREILAATVGSMFSLFILFPEMNAVFVILVKIISAAVIILIAYGYDGKKRLAKRVTVFFAASLVFSGVCFLISQTKAGFMVKYRNGNVYFDISAPVLIISTALGYSIVKLFERITREDTYKKYTVIVYSRKDKYTSFPAVSDSGNFLTDMVTGLPVIVCTSEMISGIYESIPENEEDIIKGWRIIPCRTVSGSTLIPITKPYRIFIRDNKTHHVINACGYIGVTKEKTEEAIFNPALLRDS